MDCFFHDNVPSIAPCNECGKPLCATCRDRQGSCPSCRLAAKLDAASGTRPELGGQVPPRADRPQYQQYQQAPGYAPPPTVTVTQAVAVSDDPVESRALVALGYPLWPLALLGLFDRKQSRYLRRQAYQALGFNVGFWAFGGLLSLASNIPGFGYSAWILLPFMVPIFLVLSVLYGVRVWNGEETRVPIISDWIDERLPNA